jgi:hypothetical protein
MAKTLNNAGIGEGQTIEAHHVSQSIDAFTGAEDYDISLSGSFNLTGSLIQKTGDVKFEGLSNTAPGNYVAFDSSTKTLSYATTESIISANAAAISGAFDAASASIDATITALSASLTSSIGDISASFVVTIDSVSSSLSSSIGDVTSSLTAVSAAFATTIEGISAGDDDWYSGSTFITTSRDVYIAENSLLSVAGDITGSGNLKVSGFVSASSVTASKIFIYEPNSDISNANIIPELKFKHYDYTDFTIKNDISTSPDRSTLIISSSLGSDSSYIALFEILPSTSFSASSILMPNITEGGNKFLSWDSASGRIHYTSSTPGGGGSDNDWFDGTTYITTSKDTYITGSLIVSGSNSHSIFGESLLITVLTSSTNQTGVTISKSIAGGRALTTVGTTVVSGSFFQYAPFGGLNIKAKNPATIDLSVDGTFPASILNVTASLRLTNVTGSENGQTHNIIGDTVFTSSNFFISSSNIRFPALPNDSSGYYLAYNTSNGQIAYNLTSINCLEEVVIMIGMKVLGLLQHQIKFKLQVL